jgi:chitinase
MEGIKLILREMFKRSSVTLSLALLVLSTLLFVPVLQARAGRPREAVVGYIFSNGKTPLDPQTIAAGKMTRINYAFFRVQDGIIASARPIDEANLVALRGLKQQDPHLQVVVSVGGGGMGSAGFSDAAFTPEGRRRFVDSAVQIVRQYALDGIDLDWEYPGYTHSNFAVRPEDKQNYTLLLKEMRLRFNAEGKRIGRHLVTSSATGATAIWLEHTDMRKASKWLDSVNMMCYDWYGESSRNTGHDSPLYTDPADPKQILIDNAVRMNLAAGVPPHKLVIGVPFYGRKWAGVEPQNNGLFQPITAAPLPDNTMVFAKIAPLVNTAGYTRYWDSVAMAPYLYNSATKTFITYNDAEAEMARTKYVRDHHLGGIMFWQYTGDPGNVLLDAIDKGLGILP